MNHRHVNALSANTLVVALLLAACSGSGESGANSIVGGSTGQAGNASGGAQIGSGGAQAGGASSNGTQTNTGGLVSTSVGGSANETGGAANETGGAANETGGASNRPTGGAANQTGGAVSHTGGQAAGGASGGKGATGGMPGGGATSVSAGGSGGAGTGGCTMGTWGTADPSVKGTFETVIETPVGPGAGILEDGVQPHFTVVRPKDLTKTDLCHPLITWGDGHGDNPPTYMVLLQQLASHGFVVVASLTKNASQGTPLPQVAGIDWILQENDTPTSIYYKRIDTTHIGANGHSEGGMASTMTGSDARVTAIATICGARANANLHGPALLLCGGADTIATCSGMQSAFDGISQPVMLADQLTATHGSWIGSIKDPFMIAVTAWMRLNLMDDTAQRKMFYGADCTLCTNTSVWKVQQKLLN